MRKLLALPLLIIMLALPVTAETAVFSGWLFSGQSVTVGSQTFIIYLSGTQNQVLADAGTETLFVSNNTCRKGSVAKLCLDNIVVDTGTGTHKAFMRTFSIVPSLTITRTFSDSEIRVGDEVTVSVTIANSGGKAQGIRFNDSFPEGILVITDNDEGSVEGNDLVWRGALDTDASQSLSYTLKANRTFDRSFVASVSYDEGTLRKTVFSSEVALKTIPALTVSAEMGSDEAFIGQPRNLTLVVTNKGARTLTPSVTVRFDDKLEVTDLPAGFSGKNGVYTWADDMIITNSSVTSFAKSFIFHLKAMRLGTATATVSTSYKDKSTLHHVDDVSDAFTIKDKGVALRNNFVDETLESGQLKTLRVWIQNLNPYAPISDITINVSSPLLHVPQAFMGTMTPGEQVKIAQRNFFAPVVSSVEGFKLEANATYVTMDGNRHSTSSTGTLTVKPARDLVITKTITPESVRSGETATVSVTVENPRLTRLHRVSIADKVPNELQVKGAASTLISMEPESSSTAYSYVVTAPRVSRKTSFDLTTTATYSEQDAFEYFAAPKTRTTSKTTALTVQPELFPLSVTKSVVDSTPTQGKLLQVKYVITNPSSEKTAEQPVLHFPAHADFDRIGVNDNLTLPSLRPGESIAVLGDETLFPKKAGSLNLPAANLTYLNAHGDIFSMLSNELTISIAASALSGPALRVNRSIPFKVNNTDTVRVTLHVSNNGSADATAILSDGDFRWPLALKAGKNETRTYTLQFTDAGIRSLPPAVATYSHQGRRYRAFSDAASVSILNKPLLSLEKIAPKSADTLSNFTVVLHLKPLTDEPIFNVTVSDETRSWRISKLQKEHIIEYEHHLAGQGITLLPAANATYTFGTGTFTITSNSPDVTIAEKNLLFLQKSITPTDVLPGEATTVTVTVKSGHDEELSAQVTDGDNTWKAVLAPREERQFTHTTSIQQSGALPAAVATYTYQGNELRAISNRPIAVLQEDANIIKEGKREEKSEENNIIQTVVSAIMRVLTWRRG